jgi:hypothetical protein
MFMDALHAPLNTICHPVNTLARTMQLEQLQRKLEVYHVTGRQKLPFPYSDLSLLHAEFTSTWLKEERRFENVVVISECRYRA